MKHIVITGSSRGIGYGLAKQFLERNCKVTINGTTENGVAKAISDLKQDNPNYEVQGIVSNAQNYDDLVKLWDNAVNTFGKIDIWINNAGIGQSRKYTKNLSSEEVNNLISINLSGAINGTLIALNRMELQGHGQIYNMEGFGSDGMMMERMTLYGTTKRGLTYFTKSLIKENKNSSVLIGRLNPGMVITDLLLSSLEENKDEAEKNKKIFNILADDVDTVTKFLVENILENKRNDAHIIWLTKKKAMLRFMLAPFNKRNFFE